MVDVPLDALAKAILVLMIFSCDYEAKKDSMPAHSSDAVAVVDTCRRISFEREMSR